MATNPQAISVSGAIALGIGSMVGAGIFALLGEAAALVGPVVWLSFLASGLIAALTGYVFVQLGIRYPSRGGVVEYLVQAYGTGWLSGSSSVLYYLCQLIGMAMISLAFAKYALRLFGAGAAPGYLERGVASAVIISLAVMNLRGSTRIADLQRGIVILNLTLLVGFSALLLIGAPDVRIGFATENSLTPLLGSLALTFFAFNGFAVVSNTAERMRDPSRDLPRAMLGSILIVLAVYLGLAIAVVSATDDAQLASSGPMLVAEAARTAFGDLGAQVLLFSALISSITSINGGMFGATNVTFTLAVHGQLPPRFKEELRASTHGLTISVVIVLCMINFMSLGTVASLGSATALLVFLLVNVGALRLVKTDSLRRVVMVLAVFACGLAVSVWTVYTARHTPQVLQVFVLFLVGAVLAEIALQRFLGRRVQAELTDTRNAARPATD